MVEHLGLTPDSGSSSVAAYFRRPTMEPFLVKNLPRFRGFFPWNFGVPRDSSPNLT